MNAKQPYQKRKMLNLQVNRNMQMRMIGRISGIIFISLLFSSAIYFYFSDIQITASYQMFHIKAKSFLDMLLPVVIGSFIVSLVAGFIGSLFFPKNYAGSLYRIEQDLQQVMNGDLTKKIVLRKGDEGVEVVDQLNKLISTFRDKFADIQAGLVKAQQHGGPQAPGSTDERLEAVHEIHQQLLSELQKLKMTRN